jgi:hypothetical protein
LSSQQRSIKELKIKNHHFGMNQKYHNGLWIMLGDEIMEAMT